MYLSSDRAPTQKWASKRLEQFGAQRRVLDRREPDIDYIRLAIGAYIAANAASIDIERTAHIVGSEKSTRLGAVSLNVADFSKDKRPYYLQPEHASELPAVVDSTKRALNGENIISWPSLYNAEGKAPEVTLEEFIEFLRRECGQPDRPDSLASYSRWDALTHRADAEKNKGFARAWERGLESTAEKDKEYQKAVELLSYIAQSTPGRVKLAEPLTSY